MRSFLFILSALILCSAGCDKTPPEDGIRTDSKLAKALHDTPQSLLIDGKTLVLHTELWRDFMPSVGKEERSLRAAVSISAKDGESLPTDLIYNRMVVLKGDSIWVQTIVNAERSDQVRLKANTTGGPEWAPESEVDVVVEFMHKEKAFKLRQNSVQIRATY